MGIFLTTHGGTFGDRASRAPFPWALISPASGPGRNEERLWIVASSWKSSERDSLASACGVGPIASLIMTRA